MMAGRESFARRKDWSDEGGSSKVGWKAGSTLTRRPEAEALRVAINTSVFLEVGAL